MGFSLTTIDEIIGSLKFSESSTAIINKIINPTKSSNPIRWSVEIEQYKHHGVGNLLTKRLTASTIAVAAVIVYDVAISLGSITVAVTTVIIRNDVWCIKSITFSVVSNAVTAIITKALNFSYGNESTINATVIVVAAVVCGTE